MEENEFVEYNIDGYMKFISEKMDMVMKPMTESSDDKVSLIAAAMAGSGKKLRPAIAGMFCQCLNGNLDECLNVVASIEFLHASSLLIDDMIDNDEIRRGDVSAFIKHGVPDTLLSAPHMLGIALKIGMNESSELLKLITNSYIDLSEGNILEKKRELTYEHLNKIIDLKTVPLFTGPSVIGTIFGNKSNGLLQAIFRDRTKDILLEQSRKYGQLCGKAYQYADDLVDVIQSINMGVPYGDMTKEQMKITMPIIMLHESTIDTDLLSTTLSYLKKVELSDDEYSILFQKMKELEIIQKCTVEILEICNNERMSMILQDFPDNHYRRMLIDLPTYLCNEILKEADTSLGKSLTIEVVEEGGT